MSPYISSAAWYNPVSVNYYAGAYRSIHGSEKLSQTLASMSQPSLAAVSVSPDYNTRVFALAYSGNINKAVVDIALAERGVGTNINITV
jgi:hypothetical protein